MNDEQWKKVQDARGPWIALKSRHFNEWPSWMPKLDAELRAWLHGESVVHAQFGNTNGGQPFSGDALEADGLWGVVLTERYIVRVEVEKEPRSAKLGEGRSPVVTVVPRSAITSLSVTVVDESSHFGVPIVTTASFDGLPNEIQFPADKEEYYLIPEENRLTILAGLRDDLHGYGA
ncbi:hypothetical protein [Microbacterium sp. Root280D1]|uniref:hypothetical protein n=1 Tax=Microbacterium sp. Root280D1 TaxID=1736510 RepID=UPI000A7E89E5|nr:hypothetical protein [Microbacterium sp. Root280D1]